jgi:ABC-type dipeptide/oligopeptide/nickel transport system permease subunit
MNDDFTNDPVNPAPESEDNAQTGADQNASRPDAKSAGSNAQEEHDESREHAQLLRREKQVHQNISTQQFLINLEKFRFWSIVALIVWPLLPFFILFYTLFYSLKHGFGSFFKLLGSLLVAWLFHPFHVLKLAISRNQTGLLLSVILLLPLLLTAFWGLYVQNQVTWNSDSFAYPELQNPVQHIPMGTDGQGRSLFVQIVAGARHSYLSSCIAVFVAIFMGVLLGSFCDNRFADSGISLFWVQLQETIPQLFFLMIILALFSSLSSEWSSVHLRDNIRILIMGFFLGIGFTPKVIRLIQNRIKLFNSEDFVNAVKAHGISHKAIIWKHIIVKNTLTDILVMAVQIWGFAMLMEISLSYLFSIGAAKLGGEPYASWAWLLLTTESKNALIGNEPTFWYHWWLWVFPAMFITFSLIGLYLFGDALAKWNEMRKSRSLHVHKTPFEKLLIPFFISSSEIHQPLINHGKTDAI